MNADEVLRGALDQWQAGINAHDGQRVAAVFTEDAIFQGLRPYSVGRRGVAQYYDSQPLGMTVSYRVLESRRPGPDVVLGYVHAEFAFPDRAAIGLYIGVLVERDDDGWRIGHYQGSRIDDA
jgi:uncharacterized protein (TIGR02246 family)